MRVFNFTFNKFPAKTAEAMYARELSRGFTQNIGNRFMLIVGNVTGDELNTIPHHSIGFKRKKFRTLYYFFWLPYFIFFKVKARRGACFFSNDQFLLASLIIWKKILRFSSLICADWHMFSGSWKDGFIARNADLHISTTEHLRNQIITELGARAEDIQTVHGGVSDEALLERDSLALRKELNLPLDQILVGYIGLFRTLGMEKGILTMVEALTYVPREKNIKMVFVGGKGEEIDFYQKKARELNVEAQCIFVEKVSSGGVMDYQSAMNILVIPYPDLPHYRKYGFPMKTYEYMASGVPILYSNLPIIEEVLRDYGTSFIAGNAQSLAEVVIESLASGQVIEKAKKAKQKSLEYTWKEKAKTILKYMETYEK